MRDGDWQRVQRGAYVARQVQVDERCRSRPCGVSCRPTSRSPAVPPSGCSGWTCWGTSSTSWPARQAPRAAPGRAVVDIAREEPLVEAVVVGDVVLRSGAATFDRLLACASRSAGLRGIEAARTVLPHFNGRSESPMETRLRLPLLAGGLTGLRVQHDLYGPGGHAGRGDRYVPGVVLEYDGREARLDRQVFVQERRRQTGIAELALELRRYSAADVYTRSPRELVAEVRRAQELASGRPRRLLTGPDTLRRPRLRPLPTLD